MLTVQQAKRIQMHDRTLCAGLIKLMERKEDLLAAVVSLFLSVQATTLHQLSEWLRMARSSRCCSEPAVSCGCCMSCCYSSDHQSAA